MKLDVVPAQLCFVVCTKACCSSISAFPSHTSGEPSLARAYHLKLREARFWTLWGGKKKLEVRNLSLAGSAPLQLTSLLKKSSGQEVAKEPIDLAVSRHLGQAGFPVHCHLHLVMSMTPGVSRDLVTAENVIAKLVDHHPSGPNWSADPATLPESWRWETKMR